MTIATLSDDKTKLDIELQVENGVGYSTAEERKTNTVGLIPVDADFSPVKRVAYKVEETRVGRVTNYDKVTMEVWTDGALAPEDSLREAAKILIQYLNHIVSPAEKAESTVTPSRARSDNKASKLSVEELNLPTRIGNALIGSGYETVEDILGAGRAELAKVRNLGEKSAKVIEAALAEKGVTWEQN